MIPLLALLLSGPLSSPAEQAKWALDVAPGRCALSRPLGEVTLALSTTPGSEDYALVLGGAGLPSRLGDGGAKVMLTLHDATEARDVRFKRFATATGVKDGGAIVLRGLPLATIVALGKADAVGVTAAGRTYGPYPLPSPARALAALATCERDQLVEWGADPAQFAPGGATATAIGDRDDWIDNGTLLRVHFDGGALAAQYRLGVTPEGTVDGCIRLDPGKADAADAILCKAVMGRRLFKPAHDASGHGVRGAATFQVTLFSRPA